MIKQTMTALLMTTSLAAATDFSGVYLERNVDSGSVDRIVSGTRTVSGVVRDECYVYRPGFTFADSASGSCSTATWQDLIDDDASVTGVTGVALQQVIAQGNAPLLTETDSGSNFDSSVTWTEFSTAPYSPSYVSGIAETIYNWNEITGPGAYHLDGVLSRYRVYEYSDNSGPLPEAFSLEAAFDEIEGTFDILSGESLLEALNNFGHGPDLTGLTAEDIATAYNNMMGTNVPVHSDHAWEVYNTQFARDVRANIAAIQTESYIAPEELESGDVGAISERILNGTAANACFLQGQITGRTGLEYDGYSLNIQYDPRAGTASAVAGAPGSYVEGQPGFAGFHSLLAAKCDQ